MTNACGKILMVEDDKDFAFVTKTALEQGGYAVRTACDGLQALEMAKAELPNLILLDLMLPKLDGRSVNLKLKENPRTAGVPVVVLTAYSRRKEFSEIRKDMTLAAYLEKPIAMEKILTEIGRILKPSEHPEKKVILVVDDDEDLCELLTFGLMENGYTPEVVDSGKLAKEYLSKNVPDLILSDIMMPDMNGIELCQWIHAQPRTKEVPIIQMSALANDAIVEDSADTGVMDYITKPLAFETLVKKIKLALDRAGKRHGEGKG